MTGTAGNLLRSELTKLRSVRSTVYTLLATVAMMIGPSVLVASAVAGNRGGPIADPADAADLSLLGTTFAQLAIAALGVLTISSEYRTGMIRTSFAAVPRRTHLIAAKAAVFGAVALGVGLVASFGAFFTGQAILAGKGLNVSLGHPQVLRAVVGAALYLTVTGLLGLALGTLIRHTAGAITAAMALLFVLPPLVMQLPGEWGRVIARYFPSNAGSRIAATRSPEGLLGPWEGFGVYCLWTAVIAAVALVLLHRRDV